MSEWASVHETVGVAGFAISFIAFVAGILLLAVGGVGLFVGYVQALLAGEIPAGVMLRHGGLAVVVGFSGMLVVAVEMDKSGSEEDEADA